MEFSEWITQKYISWRGNAIGQDRSITEFAAMLKVPQSLMSQWMKNKGKVPTSKKYIAALINFYGIEVYNVLGIPMPPQPDDLSPRKITLDQLPADLAQRLTAALSEIQSAISSSGIDPESEEGDKIARSIFSKHGLTFINRTTPEQSSNTS